MENHIAMTSSAFLERSKIIKFYTKYCTYEVHFQGCEFVFYMKWSF